MLFSRSFLIFMCLGISFVHASTTLTNVETNIQESEEGLPKPIPVVPGDGTLINLDELDSEKRAGVLHSIAVPPERMNQIFQVAKDVADVLNHAQIRFIACYGTLLDIIRHTTVVDSVKMSGVKKHDDDIDLGINVLDVEKLKEQAPVFNALGYNLFYDGALSRYTIEAKEKWKVILEDGTTAEYMNFIDIFVFKEKEGQYILVEKRARKESFLTKGWFVKDEFEKTEPHNFGGIFVQAPTKAKRYLKRKYGANCLTQAFYSGSHVSTDGKISYVWRLTEEEKIPNLPTRPLEERFEKFKNTSEFGKNEKLLAWNQIYEHNSLLQDPSTFAFHCFDYMKVGESLLDVGCGTARDSFWFSKKGMQVTGIDFSDKIIEQNKKIAENIQENSPVFLKVDVTLSEQLSTLTGFQNIYVRFFLHSLTSEGEKPLLAFFEAQASGTKVFLEFRTENDPLLTRPGRISHYESMVDGHYRRFIHYGSFLEAIQRLGFNILDAQEQNNLSIVQKEDYVDNPYLGRVIAEKK